MACVCVSAAMLHNCPVVLGLLGMRQKAVEHADADQEETCAREALQSAFWAAALGARPLVM